MLGIAAFVPAWLTAAGIKVFSFVTPLAPPYSYMGPGVAGFMVLGVIYLIYLYRHDPRRVVDVGLVHLDPLEEYAVMSDLQVITFRPEPGQYAWTFGGAAPVVRIRPPAVLEVFTEDCFAGRVRSENDLVSQVCEFPFLNPQTGPFYIEGARARRHPGRPLRLDRAGPRLGRVHHGAAVRRADRPPT